MKLSITYKDYIIKLSYSGVKLVSLVREHGKIKLNKKHFPVERNHGYISDLSMAIQKIIELETAKNSDTLSLIDYLNKYKAMVQEIKDLLK